MRRSNKVFTSSERRAALWLVIGCVVVASAGAAADKVFAPSLGWYGQSHASALDGVLEAQPLG